MNIANYIKDVRSRTEEQKQRVVFLWTSVFIVIIVIVWMFSFTLSVMNSSAEDARLQIEAKKLAEAKIEALKSASSTESGEVAVTKGIIPQIIELTSEGFNNITNGFWIIGNMIHK